MKSDINRDGQHEIDDIKKAAGQSGTNADQALKEIFGESFGKVQRDLDSDEAYREDDVNAQRQHHVDTAQAHAETITEASTNLARQTAEVVIGNVRQGAKEDIAATMARTQVVAENAIDLVKFAHSAAGRAEAASINAQHYALKVPVETAIEAQKDSLKAEEKALTVQGMAAQAQKLAEQAATVAEESRLMSVQAIKDSKVAIQASQDAYDAAMANKQRLVKLRAKANQISKNVKTMYSEAAGAEQLAVTVQNEAKSTNPLMR